MSEERIISLKVKALKLIEISCDVDLGEAEKTIAAWGKQNFEAGNGYIIEGLTSKGRVIEFMKQDPQPVSVEAKPGIFQRALSHFKKGGK